jgi:hypothetical protein
LRVIGSRLRQCQESRILCIPEALLNHVKQLVRVRWLVHDEIDPALQREVLERFVLVGGKQRELRRPHFVHDSFRLAGLWAIFQKLTASDALVYCAVERLDLFNRFKACHRGHLIVNDANGDGVLTLLKLVKNLCALVNDLLASGDEVTVFEQTNALEYDPQSFQIVIDVVRANDAQ